jgi:hypothetical protein
MDMHSLSVTPFYTSATDLSINQALLNNAGNPVTDIITDIDGVTRDLLQPDIGAKEYNLCGIDAGINDVVSPENPLFGGLATVRVILQNQGTTELTSTKINWSVNSTLQIAFSWSGNLAAGANTEVSVGDYNFQNGSSFLIKVWTSEPNESEIVILPMIRSAVMNWPVHFAAPTLSEVTIQISDHLPKLQKC